MKKVINFLSFTLFIFLFSNITALALEECKYYDKDNNELVLEVGGSKGNYYFKDTTYGFSTKTNLKNGVCPTSVIKLSNGIICAPGYKVKDLNKKEAICNNSLSTGILYESEKNNKSDIFQKYFICNAKFKIRSVFLFIVKFQNILYEVTL